jgi:ABC-type nitrate/sulfonate/bicarbonate transport system substrate-binding protein
MTVDAIPLRAILFRAAYNVPVTLGLERGVFAAHGLDLTIDYTRGSIMVTESLLSGAHDMGVLSADDVIYAVESRGADIFMFMGLNAGILTLMARPDIRTAADVAGRRLGVDDPASGFALVAHRILQAGGVSRTQYETVPAGGHEHRARALLEGTIDVALLTPPFTLEALARGFTVLGRGRDHLPAYQASATVTTRRWARDHADVMVAYIRAHRESLDWTLARENRAAVSRHLAAEFGLTDEQAAATFAALTDPADGLFPDARVDVAGVQTALSLRTEAGLLAPASRPLTRYYDLSYHERASTSPRSER